MTMVGKILSVELRRVDDPCPDLSHLGEYGDAPEEHHIDRKERGDMGRHEHRYFNLGCGEPAYLEKDYERAEAYNRGDWCMCGVRAVAKIEVGGVLQTIRSGGLYGIESDSGDDYFAEVAREQLAELAEILCGLGFAPDVVERAMPEDVEFVDR
jgi:hypothetical protein